MTREKLKEIKELTHSVKRLKGIRKMLEEEPCEYLSYRTADDIYGLQKIEFFTSIPKKDLLPLVKEAVSKKEEEILSKL